MSYHIVVLMSINIGKQTLCQYLTKGIFFDKLGTTEK